MASRGLVSSTGAMSAWLKACLAGVPRYRVERALPSHAGISIDAYDERLHRRVVLRVYGPAHHPARALAGARAASRVQHPAVVEVHEAGALGAAEDETVFVAIERLAPSQSLRAWLGGAPSDDEVRVTFDAICQGLQAAHDAGVVHGGLDGTAVRVRSDGRAVLIEFRGEGSPEDDQRALARLWLRARAGSTSRWRQARREAVLRRAVDPAQRSPYPSVAALRKAVAEAERAPAWPRRVAVTAAVFAAAGVWWAGAESGPQTPSCAGRIERLATDTWSPARAQRVRDGVLASGSLQAEDIAARIEEDVDAYVERWRNGAEDACSVAPQSPRMACYLEARSQIDSMLAIAQGADKARANHLLQDLARLPNLDSCEDATPVPASDARLAGAFGRLEALRHTSRDADLYALATRVLVDNPDLGDVERSRLHLYRATSAYHRRRYGDAFEESQTAHALARKGGDASGQARAAALLVTIAGYDWRDREHAERWLVLARAAATGHPTLQAFVDDAEAKLAYAFGEYTRALELAERAIALRKQERGEDDYILWSMRNNRASFLRTLQQLDDAEQAYEDLLAYQRRAYGTMNAVVGQTHNNMGAVLLEQGRFADAIESLERAVTIWRATKGPDFADLGMAYTNLGQAHIQLGRGELGLENLRAAIEVWTRAFGPTNFRVAIGRNNLAAAYTILERHEEAATEAEAALEVQIANSGADHPDNVYPAVNLAHARLELGQLGEARRWADEAVRIVQGREDDLPLETAFALVRSAEIRIAEAKEAPGDLQLRQAALGEMRNACASTETLPSSLEAAQCYTILARALILWEVADAHDVARIAIERIDGLQTARDELIEARDSLAAQLSETP